MTSRTQSLVIDDGPELHRHLQEQLAECFGNTRSIVSISRRRSPYTSSFRLDRLSVRFEAGSRLQLVLKDLSRESMLEAARRARPEFLYEPHREINAYRGILPHAPTGTAAWYGAVTEPAAGRYWLFLEWVSGRPLTQVGTFATWERTADWIARFHGAFPPGRAREIGERSGVLIHDAEFYWRWLRRAQRFADQSPDARRIFDGIARRYDSVVERLISLPVTLIHGEMYPCNVMVGRTGGRERVCPVDWEMAALGPGLINLATLSAGWSEPMQLALARAYLAAARPDLAVPGRQVRVPRDFAMDLTCCRLHLALRMLGWSDDWEPPRRHARDWLVEADRMARRLG